MTDDDEADSTFTTSINVNSKHVIRRLVISYVDLEDFMSLCNFLKSVWVLSPKYIR